MPDLYVVRNARSHIDAEWADIRPSLDRVAVQAQALIASLRDIPRPLFADERKASDAKRAAFAERLCDDISDLMGDLTGPIWHRADEAGIEPDQFSIVLTDLIEECARLEREANQVCVTERSM